MIACTGDHEFSIFDSIDDHDDYGPGPDCELFAAELVVMLGGHRGHYLGRDFVYEALALLEPDPNTVEIVPESADWIRDRGILDRYEKEGDHLIEPSFTVSEAVSEMVPEYEYLLDEAGYLTEWNDGVRIVRVGEKINREMAR